VACNVRRRVTQQPQCRTRRFIWASDPSGRDSRGKFVECGLDFIWISINGSTDCILKQVWLLKTRSPRVTISSMITGEILEEYY
jgi:hypothetical protein